jgi:cytochrome c556
MTLYFNMTKIRGISVQKRRFLCLLFAGVCLSTPAMAEPPQMRELMGALGERMGEIGEGIWREDFAAIAEAARYIAEHPKPPAAQRKRVISALGDDAPEFRAADKRVHTGSLALVEAAESGQMPAVVERYERLVEGCVACHARFRDRVRQTLHPQ